MFQSSSVAAPPPPMAMAKAMDEVAVTAQRRAVQEDLGDLKLYRVPMRVNVNANGQKQVALLEKPAVPFDLLYGAQICPEAVTHAAPLPMLVWLENKENTGLGPTLQSGGDFLFERVLRPDAPVAPDVLREIAEGE